MTNNTYKDSYRNTPTRRSTTTGRIQIVLIEIVLGMDHYLIDSDIIERFMPRPESVAVYDAPQYVEGVAVIDGAEMPIINVTPLLGMESSIQNGDIEGDGVAMILPKGRIIESGIAVTVDKVQQLVKIEKDQIMEADISGVEGIEDFVKGIIRLRLNGEEDEVLLYLNLEKMLTELLRGKISRPSPGFYVWRWTQNKKDEQALYKKKSTQKTRKSLW